MAQLTERCKKSCSVMKKVSKRTLHSEEKRGAQKKRGGGDMIHGWS